MKYTVHIEVYEEGEYIIAHDEYEASPEAEALESAHEDYPGSTIYTVCTCTDKKRSE